jgi:hypothetical protein
MESWIVEFADEEAGRRVLKAWDALDAVHQSSLQKSWIRDAGGRKLLVLIRLPAE